MNYNKVVSAARVAARDLCRLQATNRKRDELMDIQAAKASFQKQVDTDAANRTKAIARLEFQLNSVVDADPDAAEKRESIQKKLDAYAESEGSNTEDTAKTLAEYDERIAEVNKAIADIHSGETKISKENLTRTTTELLEVWATENLVPKSDVESANDAEDAS